MTAQPAVTIAFDTMLIDLHLDQIAQTRLVGEAIRDSSKFKQIRSSIQEVGIIEPVVVAARNGSRGKYVLLDGHLRLAVLKDLDVADVKCIVSSDDEGFTYNKYLNRISPIQEHRMILRALKRAVSEEKIARALNLDIRNIVRKQNLLKGICPEVVENLRDKMVAVGVFSILRQMKPFRQIEAVTLMDDMGDYTVSCARMLLAATSPEQVNRPEKPKKPSGFQRTAWRVWKEN
jgi:RepB plasmid partitioning protein/ParB-like nuclease family protein